MGVKMLNFIRNLIFIKRRRELNIVGRARVKYTLKNKNN